MDYITHMKESINTSIILNICKSREISIKLHIFSSQYIKYPIEKCRNLYNFDNKYLINNINDITSYKYKNVMKIIKLIKNDSEVLPIWIINHNNRDVLLYGIDYIIASNIVKKRYINANYIII